MTKAVTIVGSTGSIGTQAVEVIEASGGALCVQALGAFRSIDTLVRQAEALRPEVVAIGDDSLYEELKARAPRGIEVLGGASAMSELATIGDVVLNSVVGFAGLSVTVATLRSGRPLALANKESLIAGAPVVQTARATPGATILPVDSEHCAIHQCLSQAARDQIDELDFVCGEEIRRIVLTASGGPFFGRSAKELEAVTLDEALAHPTWKMGPKITIDSSTLMNKGLEVIEAHELFGAPYERIEVVVHPQSVLHSMVEFCDGATIGQLSIPNMRLPIGYALSYPERFSEPFGVIDWLELGRLEFFPPDLETFACLSIAYEAGREGGSAPAWMNAANEIAVEAFFSKQISWLQIAEVVKEALEHHEQTALFSVEDVLEVDRAARKVALGIVGRWSS